MGRAVPRAATRSEVVNVTEVANRYGVDGASVWAWITSDRVVTSPDGERVRLRADEREPDGKWIVCEERADA